MLVEVVAVGVVGVPVSAALENIVAFDSFVTLPRPTFDAVTPARIVAVELLSTLPKPTIALLTPLTVPVNVGLENIVAFDSFVTFPRPTFVAVVPERMSATLVLSTLPRPTIDLLIPATVPVNVGLAKGAFEARLVVTDVEKFSLSPKAAASSLRVSKLAGAESTRFETARSAYSVVATLSELSPAAGVAATVLPAARAPEFKSDKLTLI